MSGRSAVVVGGGVIGLSSAWRLAATMSVTVVDAGMPGAASVVAGGMLAPVTEAWPGEEQAFDLGIRAVQAWPGFAEELTGAAGQSPELCAEGTVIVAVDGADRADLDRLADFLRTLDREVDRLTARQARALEPALGPAVRGGLSVPGDLSVDNRRLLSALRTACLRAGVRFRGEPVVSAADGVRLADGHTLRPDVVVIAAGARSAELHPALAGLIRPVKGEILRLRPGRLAVPPPRRTVRAVVEGRPVYLIPRADGDLVLGATQAERGFDVTVTAGGVRELLHGAEIVMPGVTEYELVETAAGLRPGTVDNLPIVRRLAPGVIAATGHHRNGILFAPVTAAEVVALVRADIQGIDPQDMDLSTGLSTVEEESRR